MTTAVLALLLLQDADAALEKFKADLKGKDAAGRGAALAELAKTQSPKITAKINSFLVGDIPEVRVAAAGALALQTEQKKTAIPYLINGATANAKNPLVLAAILAALGKLGDEAGMVEVNKHYGAELDVAKAAIQAATDIKSPSSFDPLIKELKACDEALKPRDRTQGGGFGAGFGRMDGPNNPRESRDRAREIQPLIKGLLASMAGVTCEDGKDWESWWKENRSKFKPAKS